MNVSALTCVSACPVMSVACCMTALLPVAAPPLLGNRTLRPSTPTPAPVTIGITHHNRQSGHSSPPLEPVWVSKVPPLVEVCLLSPCLAPLGVAYVSSLGVR